MPKKKAKLKSDEIELRAVQPSAAVQSWYRQQLQDMIRSMSESLLLHIRAAWEDAPPDIGFAQDVDSIAALRRAMNKWGKRWTKNFNDMSDEIAHAFATRNKRTLDSMFAQKLKDAGFTVEFRSTKSMRQALQAIIGENVGLIKSIPSQFLKDVESQVWQSVMKGGDLSTLTRGIQKKYGVAYRRAALIARDQNAKAKATLEEQRRADLGIRFATWQHSGAGKVPRPTHVAMQGKRYDIRKGMWDSAVGKYVWPGTEINCGCTSRSIIPGVKSGS